jgi:hypothetical protein
MSERVQLEGYICELSSKIPEISATPGKIRRRGTSSYG